MKTFQLVLTGLQASTCHILKLQIGHSMKSNINSLLAVNKKLSSKSQRVVSLHGSYKERFFKEEPKRISLQLFFVCLAVFQNGFPRWQMKLDKPWTLSFCQVVNRNKT